jgi:hypothetical protein
MQIEMLHDEVTSSETVRTGFQIIFLFFLQTHSLNVVGLCEKWNKKRVQAEAPPIYGSEL